MKVIKNKEIYEAIKNQHGDWDLVDHAGRKHFCTNANFVNQFIPANTELYANYLDKNAPTPNFLKFN